MKLKDLSQYHKNTTIKIRVRIHKIRILKHVSFIILRDDKYTLQAIADEFSIINKLNPETIVEVIGHVIEPPKPIQSVYFSHLELQIGSVTVISNSDVIPIQLNNCDAGRDVRLDNRVIDLRNNFNKSIFKIRSQLLSEFRNYLLAVDFIEINTPKIVKSGSESGSELFTVNYYDKLGYLSQSPQFYKQMVINSDFSRVFEIGPVFRAEKSVSGRHLAEFTGLDIEMTFEDNYIEVIIFIYHLLQHMLLQTELKCSDELECLKTQYSFGILEIPDKPVLISFTDGVELLQNNGFRQDKYDDLNHANELELGIIVKKLYSSDLFILHGYPSSQRPFYTMPSNEDENYSYSFDIIFRGQEISSGAHRINNYSQLCESAVSRNLNMESMKPYLDSFKYGSPLHAGCGIGLDRLVSLITGVDNARMCTLFPRYHGRLTP